MIAVRAACMAALCLSLACTTDHREHLTLYSPHGREQLSLLENAFEA